MDSAAEASNSGNRFTPYQVVDLDRESSPTTDDDDDAPTRLVEEAGRSNDECGGLHFDNVSVTLPARKSSNTPPSRILSGVRGAIQPGTLTCIFGHSGAGKTTLLNVLAGRLVSSRKAIVTGDYFWNGETVKPASRRYRERVAYTEQRDALLATATVQEAIFFSARLRLPASVSDGAVELLTEQLLIDLRLTAVASSVIGGPHCRGISGGEMRRTSLAVELVTQPAVLFLDEITSGLDSHNAALVMELCHRLTRRKETSSSVVMTIHQPSSQLLPLMDRIILLQCGRVMYQGPCDAMGRYFEERGFPLPAHYNPADWIIQVAQENSLERLHEAGFFSAFPEQVVVAQPVTRLQIVTGDRTGVSIWTEMKLLLVREFRDARRDHQAMITRFAIFVAGACLIAIVYNGVGDEAQDSPTSLLSHVGAVFLLVVTNLITVQLTILDVSAVRHVFVREFSSGHYHLISCEYTKPLRSLIC